MRTSALALTVVLLFACPLANAAPPPASDDHVPADTTVTAPVATAEVRCDELARELEARLEELRARTPADDVARVEAEEIGRVADELIAEGDLEVATALFREALALVTSPAPAP